MSPPLLLAAVAGALALLGALITTGPAGVLYTLLFAAAAAPGLPLGFRLFGRRAPAAWIAGALIGYVLTAFAFWAVIAAHAASGAVFVGAWAVLAALTWFGFGRPADGLVTLPAWTRGATVALSVVLACTLLLSVPPLARVGERDAKGNRLYRAYFTADFVWHTALTSELTRFEMPPRNPYLASEPIHYYWAYFLVPAVVAQTGPSPVRDVQACLKVNAQLTGVLLMSSVFMLAWSATGGAALAAGCAVILALLAGSFEGIYEIYRLWSRGQHLAALRDTNIDAITAWHFGGHRIDGLPRCLWYVPQHSMAYSMGLTALTAAVAAGSDAGLLAILLQGIALAGATAINPFVGAVFAAAWGLAVAIDAVRRPDAISRILRHAAAAIPVAAALAWCIASKMVEGAGGVLEFGLAGASSHAPLWSLFLSLGPVLLPAGAALVFARPAARAIVPALTLITLALFLMFFVRLRVDTPWVPFRAGQMILVAAPAAIATWLVWMWHVPALRLPGTAAFAALLLLGLPTTVVDAYNAQDTANQSPGPGFHWTGVLPVEAQQAFAWIKRATPRDAIVQMEPTVRDREIGHGNWGEWWSLIPTFAERRMAAGLPISLMRVPEYLATSERVKTMFATADAAEAAAIARSLGITYVYVDGLDRAMYPDAEKFDRAPEHFTPQFRRGPVGVYLVH